MTSLACQPVRARGFRPPNVALNGTGSGREFIDALELGTHSDTDSDIEIVDSVELGKRLRIMREKAQNKRMKNPALTQREALHDEVAYVLTTSTLLKEVQATVQADKDKRWQPSSSKRHKHSFRKCENSSCSAAAINLRVLSVLRGEVNEGEVGYYYDPYHRTIPVIPLQ
jgi:hypothetical protein